MDKYNKDVIESLGEKVVKKSSVKGKRDKKDKTDVSVLMVEEEDLESNEVNDLLLQNYLKEKLIKNGCGVERLKLQFYLCDHSIKTIEIVLSQPTSNMESIHNLIKLKLLEHI